MEGSIFIYFKSRKKVLTEHEKIFRETHIREHVCTKGRSYAGDTDNDQPGIAQYPAADSNGCVHRSLRYDMDSAGSGGDHVAGILGHVFPYVESAQAAAGRRNRKQMKGEIRKRGISSKAEDSEAFGLICFLRQWSADKVLEFLQNLC